MLLSHQTYRTMIGARMQNNTHAHTHRVSYTSVTCVHQPCMLSPGGGLLFFSFLECHSLFSRNHVVVFLKSCSFVGEQQCWDAGLFVLKITWYKTEYPAYFSGRFLEKHALSQLPFPLPLSHSLSYTHTHTHAHSHSEPQKTLLSFSAVGRKQDCS